MALFHLICHRLCKDWWAMHRYVKKGELCLTCRLNYWPLWHFMGHCSSYCWRPVVVVYVCPWDSHSNELTFMLSAVKKGKTPPIHLRMAHSRKRRRQEENPGIRNSESQRQVHTMFPAKPRFGDDIGIINYAKWKGEKKKTQLDVGFLTVLDGQWIKSVWLSLQPPPLDEIILYYPLPAMVRN